jgi:prepilin-type N-terminal cleavage/methylation domain-containing protein
MMKRVKCKGLTLVEVLISIFLLSIIAVLTLGFVNSSNYLRRQAASRVDENMNLRIGLEYLAREIQEAKSLKLIEKINHSETEVDEFEAESVSSNPRFYVYIDGERLFLIDNIIRRHTESQQIVSGIKTFSIKYNEEGLYTLKISSEKHSVSTRIYKRK